MLQQFELRNFKAFRQQSFDLAPITVFVGRNGTGKSSVLQALAFLKQSSLAGKETYSVTEAKVLTDLGSFAEVVHMRDSSLPVEIKMLGQLDTLGPVPWPSRKETPGQLPITLGYKRELSDSSTPKEWITLRPWQPPGIDNLIYVPPESSEIQLGNFAEYPDVRQDDQKSFLAADEDGRRLGWALPIQLRRFFFVPAGRGFVGQTFPLQDDASDDLSTAMGYSEFANKAATKLAMSRGLEEQVSDWLEQVTGLRIRAELGRGKTVNITFQPPRNVSDRIAVGANNESFGANQLSHVFLKIALAGDEATIGIEEPEVHLHPRAQRDLVETLVRIAKEGSRQFIISTHSERVVSRLLVLVTKGVLRPEDLAVYAFDKDEEGVASAKPCEIDENGQVAGGIPGFFEESITDMSDVVGALSGPQG